jgi:TetR/AcrR family transcriptional regulator
VVRPRAENYEERRVEILDTAAALFAARGFEATSMSSIAGALGVSKALVYHYFESKEELLFEMLLSHCRLLIETANRAVASGNAEEKLKELIASLMQLYMSSRDKHVVLMNCLKALSLEQQAEIKGEEKKIVAIIKGLVGQIKKDSSAGEVSATAMYLMGSINWTYTWFKEGGAISAQDYAELASRLFLEGLKRQD